jgi:hypothetical protein
VVVAAVEIELQGRTDIDDPPPLVEAQLLQLWTPPEASVLGPGVGAEFAFPGTL